MADCASVKTSKTAYVEIFKDDNVPYILIGDGKEDGKWDLTFYIASSSETDSSGGLASPDNTVHNNNGTNNNGTNGNGTSGNGTNGNNSNGNGTAQGVGGSSGGGGCNVSGMLTVLMIAGISFLKSKR
ncbi:MAG: hypothetical protein IJG36_01830 [Synergistaceae bacterium]|nr:hypothetical protein [Synergistaceae bacterium]